MMYIVVESDFQKNVNMYLLYHINIILPHRVINLEDGQFNNKLGIIKLRDRLNVNASNEPIQYKDLVVIPIEKLIVVFSSLMFNDKFQIKISKCR